MVKHIIIWKLKEELTEEEKEAVKARIKTNLEALPEKIEGLLELRVQTEKLSSSNADLMLESTFESEEALKYYANHPEHTAVANRDVRPYTAQRSCLDFEI